MEQDFSRQYPKEPCLSRSKENDDDGDDNDDSIKLAMDGVTYQIGTAVVDAVIRNAANSNNNNNNQKPNKMRWVRQYLEGQNNEIVLGPIVGCISNGNNNTATTTTNLDDLLNQLELDPVGFGGEYVVEVLDAQPIRTHDDGISTHIPSSLLSSAAASVASNPPPWKRLRQELQDTGLTVWTDALSPTLITAWRDKILTDTNKFHSHGQAAEIRSDVVQFVSQRMSNDNDSSSTDEGNKAALTALDFLEHVVAKVTEGITLDDDHYTLWRPDQGMLACYQAARQAHYTWHYDNEKITHKNNDNNNDTTTTCWRNYRTLTAILYLNPHNWQVNRDGGALECQTVGQDKNTILVGPKGGTVVVFDSRRIRHRVLPAHADRLAVTQWFVSPALQPAPVGIRQLHWSCRKALAASDDDSNQEPPTKKSRSDQTSFCHVVHDSDTNDAKVDNNFSFGFF